MESRGENGVASSLWSKPKMTREHRTDLTVAAVDSQAVVSPSACTSAAVKNCLSSGLTDETDTKL